MPLLFSINLTLAHTDQGSKTTARSQTQTFTSLHNDVTAFSEKCIAFADTRNAELTAKIKTLNDEISALAKELSE